MEEFSCGQKEKTIDDAIEIGVEGGGLYKLKDMEIQHYKPVP